MPTMRRIYTMTMIIALMMNCSSRTVNIIIDLGGVLIKTKKSVMTDQIGMMNLMGYTFTHFKSPRKDFYTFMDSVKPPTRQSTISHVPYDERHRKIPRSMCEWLKGVPSQKILKRVSKANPSPLNLKLAQTVFNPAIMSKSKQIIQAGVQFVQECRSQGHDVYILANQDAESFKIFMADHPDFIKLFSGVVISGDCALLKPDPAIFKYLLKKYDLETSNCFFIDDQKENIEVAKKLGIATYKVDSKRNNPNFKKIRVVLNKWVHKTT